MQSGEEGAETVPALQEELVEVFDEVQNHVADLDERREKEIRCRCPEPSQACCTCLR